MFRKKGGLLKLEGGLGERGKQISGEEQRTRDLRYWDRRPVLPVERPGSRRRNRKKLRGALRREVTPNVED